MKKTPLLNRGGAISLEGGGQESIYLTNCDFIKNTSAGNGGAIYVYWGSNTEIDTCTFAQNSSTGANGGAIWDIIPEGQYTISKSTFSENSAHLCGGAIYHESSLPAPLICSNCLFDDNAAIQGGGVYFYYEAVSTLTNCTFSNNSAVNGGSIGCNSFEQSYPNSITVSNSILWDGNGTIWNNDSSSISIQYSNIFEGWTGQGNISTNPLFADPNHGNLNLLAGSPCIDTGDNTAVTETTDLNGRPRIFDGDGNGSATVDMGAYEYQPFIIYVDDSATNGANNGTSWENAFICLQDALSAAVYGDQLRVAQGTYKPDRSTAYPNGTGDRSASFHLVNGAALIGGYAGFEALDPDERNLEQFETILSGDLLANDSSSYASLNLCQEDPNLTDNCYNVVTSIETDNDTIIDGFSITGGYAFVDWEMYGQESMGAGLYNSESDLTIIHCVFRNNISYASGIAIYNQSANPQILSCTFDTNVDHGSPCANPETAHGVINNVNSSPIISKCCFSHNRAYAIGNSGGTPVIEDCIFEYNHGVWIGAIENWLTNVEIRNCSFIRNGGRIAGAIANWNSAARIKHCIFAGNYSDQEYLYPGEGGTIWEEESNSIITNCTFYENCGAPLNGYDSEDSFVSNSIFYKNFNSEDPNNIVDGPVGPYNYNEDPLLADPNNGDFHLKSEYGRWDPASQTWLYDNVTSPCIDEGDPADPNWTNELWPHGKRINMGAYGGTPQASKSPSTAGNIADFTFDDCVAIGDFAEFIDQWLTCQALLPEDMDTDGCVNLVDFSIFAQNWFLLCPASDLVGSWQFNETSGDTAHDSSAYSNHGTLFNGPVWTGDGKLQFDGVDDYVEVSDSSSLAFTNQITLSAWIMLTEDNLRFMKIVIQPANDTSADPWENYCLDLRRKNPRFSLSSGLAGSWTGAYDTTWNSPITVGAWYHLAGTYDGSMMILYVNGLPTQTKTGSLTIGNNVLPLYMGSAQGTNGFGGMLDEVRIYNRALTPTEIQDLYQGH